MYAKIFKERIGFQAMVDKLMAEGKSEESARRIAAAIGRKKYGAKGMAARAADAKAPDAKATDAKKEEGVEVAKSGTTPGAVLGWKNRRLNSHEYSKESDQALRDKIGEHKSLLRTARDILIGRKVKPTKTLRQSAKDIFVGNKVTPTKTLRQSMHDVFIGDKVNKGFASEALGLTPNKGTPHGKYSQNSTRGVLATRF